MNTRPLFEFISRHKIYLLLFLGLVVGLTYVFLVPPWMHYDEPGHFEYAWLAANQNTWPKEGDYDQYMRREVAASMMEHRFDHYTGVSLPITSIYEPVKLLISQLGDKPLYYFLVSLPLRLVKYTDITFQLYIARFVSSVMFLVTVWIAWKVASLLFGSKHPMSWMVPAALIAIPGFVDLMTAVNNDALAILGFSAFVWASVLLLQRGFSPLRLLFLIFSVLVCYYAKSTAWLAIPLSLIVLPFSIVRGKQQKFVWIGLGLFLVLTIALGIDWGKTVPAYYVTTAQQQTLLRVSDERAPSGKFVLKHSGQSFHQMITKEGQSQIAGKSVIFAARIWADQETDIKFPVLGRLDMQEVVLSDQTLHITTEPALYGAKIDIPAGDYIAWISLFGSKNTAVFWDDLGLIVEQPSDVIQEDLKNYVNVLRNSSMEEGFPKFTAFVDNLLSKTDLNIGMSQITHLFDLNSVWWYYSLVSRRLFKMFWASIGWGDVTFLSQSAYEMLLGLTIVSGVASFFFLIKKYKSLPKATSYLFLIIIVLQAFFTFARGAGTWYTKPYYSAARYLYPAMLPIVTFFVHGIFQMLEVFRNTLVRSDYKTLIISSSLNMVYLFSVMAMIIWGIIAIHAYYI